MDPVIPPLLDPPIAFAHRGARAHAPENTLEAFRLAVRLGATGVESDVWLTADRHPVLHHSPTVGRRWRKRAIGDLDLAALPDDVLTLEQLYAAIDSHVHVSLAVKDPAAVPAVLAVAHDAEADALPRLWLGHPSWTQVAEWRSLDDEVRLVVGARVHRLAEGPERLAAALADAGVDALSLHWSDWTGGLTTLVHRFRRLAFGWDAQHERALATLIRVGVDGISSDHVDRLVDEMRGVRGT